MKKAPKQVEVQYVGGPLDQQTEMVTTPSLEALPEVMILHGNPSQRPVLYRRAHTLPGAVYVFVAAGIMMSVELPHFAARQFTLKPPVVWN